jgi:PAS domain S-box-containing protein
MYESQRLSESEECYRAMAEDSPGLICRFLSDCCITYVNPSYCRYFGKSSEELVGSSFLSLVPEEDREAVRAKILALTIESPTMTYEHRVTAPTGEIRWQRWTDRALFDDMGILRAYQSIGEDITERKRAEETIQRAEVRFRTIYNSASEALMMLNQDGFSDCNATTLALFGINSTEEFCSLHPANLSPPRQADGCESLPAANKHIKTAIREGRHRFEWLHKRLDTGEVFPAEVILTAMMLDGKKVLQASVRDITEQKLLEQKRREMDVRLQQTQRLESLGVLAGGIAHDFNNILMAIMGHAELALDELSPLSPTRENLTEITNASKRAAELCGQMLAYAGKGQFEQRDISLSDLSKEILNMLKTCISKKCVLNMHLEKELPCMHGDPSQIRQILVNLVINASEAIGDRSGMITLSSGTMEWPEQYLAEGYVVVPGTTGTYVYFEVSDTGCGIDREALQRIFDPFFTTKFTGRGLGLSAVMGIVRAHGGALTVRSEHGEGTTFKVLFPTIAAPGGTGQATSGKAHWRGEGTILLVDDEEIVRTVSGKLLQRLGLSVLTAADGQQAVDLYRKRHPEIDVVLLDLTIPHINGEEAYRELRKINPDVRVILASGYSEIDVASRFAGKRLAGCLQKPYTLAKLCSLLSGLLPETQPPPITEHDGCPNRAIDSD